MLTAICAFETIQHVLNRRKPVIPNWKVDVAVGRIATVDRMAGTRGIAVVQGHQGRRGVRPERPYAKRSISASASAISGISGVGENPSSAGPRTAWASIGRAVD